MATNIPFSIESILKKDDVPQRYPQRIRVFLQSAELWARFHELGTEMIVTKTGRRMFPTLSFIVCGLEPEKMYTVKMVFENLDNRRYRYSFHQSRWVSTGPGDLPCPRQKYSHSDGLSKGSHWMKAPISFDKLKLTNNLLDDNGHVIVNSMHKYQPKLVIEEENGRTEEFAFEQTCFIAVTAYQNHRITSLKIESNPFAKGFRECEFDEAKLFPLMFPYYFSPNK